MKSAKQCGQFRRLLFVGLPLAVWTLLSPLPLHAQRASGTLVRTVKDQSGAAIPQATVTVLNRATGNLAIQRQFGANTSLTLAYVGSPSRKLAISVTGNEDIRNPYACRLYPAECQPNNGIIPPADRFIVKYAVGDNLDQRGAEISAESLARRMDVRSNRRFATSNKSLVARHDCVRLSSVASCPVTEAVRYVGQPWGLTF